MTEGSDGQQKSEGALPLAAGGALALAVGAFGFMMLPAGDAITKWLVQDGMSPIQVGWGRWVAHTIVLSPIVLWMYGRGAVDPPGKMLLLTRGALIAMASLFYYSALKTIPLADAAAVLFVAPLMVTALSALILREKVGIPRWAAVVSGFLGMLFIVKPGAVLEGGAQVGSLWALAAAGAFAAFMVLSRGMAGRHNPVVTLYWVGLAGLVTLSPFVVPVWVWPTPVEWLLLGAIGLIAGLAHLLIIWAADRAEASALAPVPYMEMIGATILGYLVFGHFPDGWTWLGCGIVVAAGIFVALRERRIARVGIGKTDMENRNLSP